MKELQKGYLLQEGKYTIVKMLGKDNFGITYLATTPIQMDGALGKLMTHVQVVIKEYFMEDLDGRSKGAQIIGQTNGNKVHNYKQEVLQEADNQDTANHPRIVRALDMFKENNTTYYVMEYIEGYSHDDYFVQHGHLPQSLQEKKERIEINIDSPLKGTPEPPLAQCTPTKWWQFFFQGINKRNLITNIFLYLIQFAALVAFVAFTFATIIGIMIEETLSVLVPYMAMILLSVGVSLSNGMILCWKRSGYFFMITLAMLGCGISLLTDRVNWDGMIVLLVAVPFMVMILYYLLLHLKKYNEPMKKFVGASTWDLCEPSSSVSRKSAWSMAATWFFIIVFLPYIVAAGDGFHKNLYHYGTLGIKGRISLENDDRRRFAFSIAFSDQFYGDRNKVDSFLSLEILTSSNRDEKKDAYVVYIAYLVNGGRIKDAKASYMKACQEFGKDEMSTTIGEIAYSDNIYYYKYYGYGDEIKKSLYQFLCEDQDDGKSYN